MTDRTIDQTAARELWITPADRATLVRSFTAWCGDPATAEDLTQETLFEAWKSGRMPDDPAEWTPWLFGIARNVLLRWRRAMARHSSQVISAPESAGHLQVAADDWNLDDLLERSDLVELLDAALARIPAASRQALLLRYVDELPQKEIAARLGLREKALEGRLHRGKTALQRYLATEGASLAAGYDLIPTASDTWVSTRIWCMDCGRQRLEGRWGEDGSLWLDCPACDMFPVNGWRSTMVRTAVFGEAGTGLRERFRAGSFLAALRATHDTAFGFVRDGISTIDPCPRCGGETRILRYEVPFSPAPEAGARCIQCGMWTGYGWMPGPTASHPDARQWCRDHPRRRFVPPRVIERLGRPTLVFEWESLTTNESLVIFRDLETLEFQGDILIDRHG